MSKPQFTFFIKKQIRASSVGEALKNEKKGEIIDVYKSQEVEKKEQAPAIGFEIPDEDYD